MKPIADPEAQHVGCCCGVLPASGNFAIPADVSELTVTTTTTTVAAAIVDTCAEADALSKGKMDTINKELGKTEYGKDELKQEEAALKEAYPQIDDRCASRRLHEDDESHSDENENNRALSEDGARNSMSRYVEELEGSESDEGIVEGLVDAFLSDRRLSAPYLSCSPPAEQPADQSETLKVAFWQRTEESLCNKLPPATKEDRFKKYTSKGSYDTAYLADTCSKFCGRDAVPFLVGSPNFGFTLKEMEGVCVDSNLVTTDTATIKDCHRKSEVMSNVNIKVAHFVATLDILEIRKLEYEATVQKAAKELQATIQKDAQKVLEDASVNLKIYKYNELLLAASKEVARSSAAVVKFKYALKDLERVTGELKAVLEAAVPIYKDFISGKCGNVYTGKGAQQEYLLDICSQTSKECLGSKHARHAGCCCGYSPHMAVGKPSLSLRTIPGISSGSSLAGNKSRVGFRRLSSQSAKAAYDICAEAFNMSAGEIVKIQESLKKLGGSNLLNERNAKLKAKYPAKKDDFCWVKEWKIWTPVGEKTIKMTVDKDGPKVEINASFRSSIHGIMAVFVVALLSLI
eukprot:TRINITY_DN26282_c0_g1_i1.p1 TRINITY_DN26282_c0_g1~~TRINITY_DN26282_c0_g1_i1.p1  ORF type:complete len:575 (-),score=132.27 TRINITY_DN26282_c0_g1_i1:89-1813(-)